MKETLSADDRKAIVAYRLEKANEALSEARFTADAELYNLAINRLYYACYYAASAILIQNKIIANTHAGVKTQFHLHYIKEQILPREDGTTLSLLFNLRHSGDYEDFVECDSQMVKIYLPRAEKFIQDIMTLIKANAVSK